MTTSVIKMAMMPATRCTGDIPLHIGPSVYASSSIKRTNPILKTLLPKTLDMANSGAPILTAAKDVASSGREVLNA